jgi:hypothetical protein
MWMAESELDGARELIDEFVTQLHYTQFESWDGSWERVCSKGEQQRIRRLHALDKAEPKRRRGRPRNIQIAKVARGKDFHLI